MHTFDYIEVNSLGAVADKLKQKTTDCFSIRYNIQLENEMISARQAKQLKTTQN